MFVVLCNCPPTETRTLARTLVGEGLVACVNVIPGVQSFYEWEGALQEEREDTLLMKTTEAKVLSLGDRIRELHSYDTVEILALPVDDSKSDPGYLDWVRRVCS